MRYLLSLFLLASPLAAQQRTPIDYALAGTATGLMLADWSQTLQIARTPWRIESNPILGPRPTIGQVNTLLALETLGTLAAFRLPTRARRLFYVTVIILQTVTVAKNLHAGLTIGF